MVYGKHKHLKIIEGKFFCFYSDYFPRENIRHSITSFLFLQNYLKHKTQYHTHTNKHYLLLSNYRIANKFKYLKYVTSLQQQPSRNKKSERIHKSEEIVEGIRTIEIVKYATLRYVF